MSAGAAPVRIGDRVAVRRANGYAAEGEIATLQTVGDRLVAGVRFADGAIERLVVTRDQVRGLGPSADNVGALAVAILNGAPVRLPVNEQLRVLAAAVAAQEFGGMS